MTVAEITEAFAVRLFNQAIAERRAAELLECLFDGGSATIQPDGKIALASADQLASLVPVSDDQSDTALSAEQGPGPTQPIGPLSAVDTIGQEFC